MVVAPRKAILLFGCDLSAEAGQRRKLSMIERNKKWTDFWGFFWFDLASIRLSLTSDLVT